MTNVVFKTVRAIRLKTAFFAVAAVAVMTSASAAYDIGLDMENEAFWNSDPVLFVSGHRNSGFSFTSDARESADSRLDKAVTCFGIPVYESRVHFGPKGGIVRVELMLFSAGGTEDFKRIVDADGREFRKAERVDRPISREEFSAVIEKVRGYFADRGVKTPRTRRELSGFSRQFSQTWREPSLKRISSLTWNYRQKGKNKSTFRGGFIRFAVDGPAGLKESGMRGESATLWKKAKGAGGIGDNLVDESRGRGDVFVDNVPMVDQGLKGYCAVAAAERVLRYYGLEIDEHQLASDAGTSADGGTSIARMKKTVEKAGKRHRLGTVVCYGDFHKGISERIAGLNDEVRFYNKAAKKLQKPEIADDVYITRRGNTVFFNPAAVDAAADPEVLREMKVNGGGKSRFTRFKKDVRDQIKKGIPLLWGVRLGVYPEPGIPQTAGGHMRLIIGYNDRKGEILYSDSWGAGHEMKRMPEDWAWTITDCLMYLKPLSR